MWSSSRVCSSVGASSSGPSPSPSASRLWRSSDSERINRRSCAQNALTKKAGSAPLSSPCMAVAAAAAAAAGSSRPCMGSASRRRQQQRKLLAPSNRASSSAAAAAAAGRPLPPSGGPPSMQDYSSSDKDAWRKAYDQKEDNDYLSLSNDEIQTRLLEATALVAMVLDLRPLDRRAFNSSLEVWQALRRVPPWERHRLLEDLEPGAIRGMWKASMERYVLEDDRAMDLAEGYSIWQDFPEASGQIYTYEGRCEQYALSQHVYRIFEDRAVQKKPPQEKPWLRPTAGALPIQTDSFKMLFFVQPVSGQLFARLVFPWLGPVDRWWLPCYLKLKMELALTPIKADAGADITFEYPHPETEDLNGWAAEEALLREQLPNSSWPGPELEEPCGSPFSVGPRDFVRVAAPGVYVGCAYRSAEPGLYAEDDCVYFVIVRKMSREEYVRQEAEGRFKHSA